MTQDARETLRRTFDQDAELYDRARPGYPEQLLDDACAVAGLGPGSAVLEIGSGTGHATLPPARRGCSVVCVELGRQLAAVARTKLARFPRVAIVTAPFETWTPPHRAFDAVFAASSWHWLDPDVRYVKAAALLRPGGALAIVRAARATRKRPIRSSRRFGSFIARRVLGAHRVRGRLQTPAGRSGGRGGSSGCAADVTNGA